MGDPLTALLLGWLTLTTLYPCLLVVAILLLTRRRRTVHVLVGHVLVVVIVDCMLDGALAVFHAWTGEWSLGMSVCRLNAFAQQWVALAMLAGILLILLERAYALTWPTAGGFDASTAMGVTVGSASIMAILSVALLVDGVPVVVDHVAHRCRVDEWWTSDYSRTVLGIEMLMYVLSVPPIGAIMRAAHDRRRRRSTVTAVTDDAVHEGVACVMAFVVYGMTHMPHTILAIVVNMHIAEGDDEQIVSSAAMLWWTRAMGRQAMALGLCALSIHHVLIARHTVTLTVPPTVTPTVPPTVTRGPTVARPPTVIHRDGSPSRATTTSHTQISALHK